MDIDNTLIVYASRHGTTSEYAKHLFHILDGNVDLCFLNERGASLPDLSVYSTIIIGGSIHYGKNSKSVIKFTNDNKDILKTKRLGLFVVCHFEGDKAMEQLKNAYPKELLDRAIVSDFFDGELLFPKMNFWEKLIAKLVLSSDEITPIISRESVEKFANRLQPKHEV